VCMNYTRIPMRTQERVWGNIVTAKQGQTIRSDPNAGFIMVLWLKPG
jgi:hypothetical protein